MMGAVLPVSMPTGAKYNFLKDVVRFEFFVLRELNFSFNI